MDGTVFALSCFLYGIESDQQAAQGVNHRLAANCFAVAGKYDGFRDGFLADPTPAKAYGPHWLTR